MAPAGCLLCVLVLCPVVVGNLVVLVCSVFSRWTLHHSSSSPSASSSWQPPHNQQAATQQRNTTARTGHAAFFGSWRANASAHAHACVRWREVVTYACVPVCVVAGCAVGGLVGIISLLRLIDFMILLLVFCQRCGCCCVRDCCMSACSSGSANGAVYCSGTVSS